LEVRTLIVSMVKASFEFEATAESSVAVEPWLLFREDRSLVVLLLRRREVVRNLERRSLRFRSLEEAVADAQKLLLRGYYRAGSWDLSQCCHHLAVLMHYPIDGFPPFRFPLNMVAPLLRYTVAPVYLRRILASGVWPAGNATDTRTILPPGGDDAAAVDELSAAVERLASHTGPFRASPLFGMLDKPTLLRLHCIHTAHHLSFLIPKDQ
jgi:hypothetical protein